MEPMEPKVLTGKVESFVRSESGTFWKMQLSGQKFPTNVFDKTPGRNLIAVGKTLRITLVKGDKYWNIDNIKELGGSKPQSAPQPQQSTQPRTTINTDNKHRAFALRYSVDLLIAKAVTAPELYIKALEMERFLNGQDCPTDDNLPEDIPF